MADNLTPEQRHKNMTHIKSTNTKIEKDITNALWNLGYRFRKNVKGLPGKPDIAIKKHKVVIFLDSCFWHKCPKHFKKPKSNLEYWEPKIKRNVERDAEINRYYQNKNWHILSAVLKDSSLSSHKNNSANSDASTDKAIARFLGV